MDTRCLKTPDATGIKSIMARHGITDFDAAVRVHGGVMAIDGTLAKQDLACLLAIAQYMDERPGTRDSN